MFSNNRSSNKDIDCAYRWTHKCWLCKSKVLGHKKCILCVTRVLNSHQSWNVPVMSVQLSREQRKNEIFWIENSSKKKRPYALVPNIFVIIWIYVNHFAMNIVHINHTMRSWQIQIVLKPCAHRMLYTLLTWIVHDNAKIHSNQIKNGWLMAYVL